MLNCLCLLSNMLISEQNHFSLFKPWSRPERLFKLSTFGWGPYSPATQIKKKTQLDKYSMHFSPHEGEAAEPTELNTYSPSSQGFNTQLENPRQPTLTSQLILPWGGRDVPEVPLQSNNPVISQAHNNQTQAKLLNRQSQELAFLPRAPYSRKFFPTRH